MTTSQPDAIKPVRPFYETIRVPVSLALGGCLVALAVLIPTTTWVAQLRPAGDPEAAPLLPGATILRVGLGLLGLLIAVLGNLRIWKATRPVISQPLDRHAVIALGLILLAAAGLRLYGLDAGLWYDEIVTNVLYVRLPLGVALTSYASENQHFLYTLLAHLSLNTFGESAWALRLPAALFGIASVWALFQLGREVASTREALLAAALLACSYTAIWFSQNARGYSGLLFLALLTSWLYLQAWRTGHAGLWVGYAIAAALGVYLHFTMVFVIAGHALLFLPTLFRRQTGTAQEKLQALGLGFGLAGFFTLLLYALVLPEMLHSMGRETSLVEEWKNPLWTLLEVARGMQLSFAGSAVALIALAVFTAGVVSYLRTRPEVVFLLILPAGLGAAIVIALGHHLWPRFFFFALGFAVLILIRGCLVAGLWIAWALRLAGPRAAWPGTALGVLLVAFSAASVPLAYGPKQDYAGAIAYIERNWQPGDAVRTAGLAAFPLTHYYGTDWPEATSVADFNATRATASRTWLVYTFPPTLEAVDPALMALIRQDCPIQQQFHGTVSGGTVIVCRSDRLVRSGER